jgi:uncharacterized membrane protein YphA (DoxX/SURF4 family)
MWKKIRHGYRQFAEGEPGHRFVDTYEQWQESVRHPLVGLALIIAAIVLILGGLFLALIPGVPGIVLGVLGFALIAIRFRRVAVWLDWSEVHLRKLLRRFRRVRRGQAAR